MLQDRLGEGERERKKKRSLDDLEITSACGGACNIIE